MPARPAAPNGPGSVGMMRAARRRRPQRPAAEWGTMLANTVYERTRSALTGLLPRRAATSVLDRALRRHRRSPDEVSGEQMAHVLLQGVYRELRGVVPDPGLRRTLRKLARDARAWSPASRGATPSEVEAGPARPGPAVLAAASTEPQTTHERDVDGFATVLAALDGVHGVAVFDAAGRPLDVRGALPDAAGLGGLVAAGAALVAREGALRSVAIDTPGGRLVAIPVPPRWIALMGTVDVNLGAVYAALAALEEER